jgi:hypothetical protein
VRKKRKTYIEQRCIDLVKIERKTMKRLGRKAHLFVHVANDWIDINGAILDAYPKAEAQSFLLITFWGLFKEVSWLQLFFVAGNYPLLLSRLRFIWESVFRAYYAETYQPRSRKDGAPGPSPDDKAAWLEQRERQLGWSDCLRPTLRKVVALPESQQIVDGRFELWKHLCRYVHPSAYLAGRMVGRSALHATDNFDRRWAVETLEAATCVFDLVWLAVLSFYPKALVRLTRDGLLGEYPLLGVRLSCGVPKT